MTHIAYLLLAGLLARADGWDTANPKWARAKLIFNGVGCSILFAVITLAYASPMAALASGASFFVFRAPAFHGWELWGTMFWRGWWPAFVGFTLVSLAVHANVYYGLLSVPFALAYTLVYSGGYAWLPDTILGFNRHVWVEHASGWIFAAFITLILKGV